jgi:cell division protein FtsI (penicillin-binding protein 3)
MRWGRFRISDFRNYGPELTVTEVIVKSSNIGTGASLR